MKQNKKLMTAREAMKCFDVSYATINNYTDLGLLKVVSRRKRERLYDSEQAVSRMAKIKQWAQEGYPLRLIVQKLNRNGRSA